MTRGILTEAALERLDPRLVGPGLLALVHRLTASCKWNANLQALAASRRRFPIRLS